MQRLGRLGSAIIVLCCTAAAIAIYAAPAGALAEPLSPNEFTALAARCAPAVPMMLLEAVAQTESRLDPLALHNNTTSQHETIRSAEIAVAMAGEWLGRGDSVDIGLMQINSANLASLGMTISNAFDPCVSLAAGAAILRAAYGGGNTQAQQQAALLIALSRYNTGTPFKGIMNGYVRTVLQNGTKGNNALPIPLPTVQAPLFSDPNAPPPWNVSAAGVYAQQHGASWIVDLAPPSTAGLTTDIQFVTAARAQLPRASIASFPTLSTTR